MQRQSAIARCAKSRQTPAPSLNASQAVRVGRGGAFKPVIRNVTLEHITSQKSKRAVNFRGYDNAPITGIRLAHCSFDNAAEENVIEHVDGLKIEDVKRNGQAMGEGAK